MARQSPSVQRIVLTGLEVALTAPNVDGDIIPAGQVALLVRNGSGADITVTAVTPGTVAGLAIADSVSTVTAGEDRLIGPFPAGVFAQPADAVTGPLKVLVNYSAVASVTRAVVSF